MHNSKHYLETSESREALTSDFAEDFIEEEGIEQTTSESVDELRERLERMKKLMAERTGSSGDQPARRKTGPVVIDGNFLSVMFGLTLFVILIVSFYAFYNLFWAIWKRNSRYHEEL